MWSLVHAMIFQNNSSLTTLLAPTVISRGVWRIFFATFSTDRGNVALNMTVCLSGRMFSMILMIWGSNPKSNMRSASSNTRYVTRRRLVIFPLLSERMSIIRPGVHTTISEPLLRSAIWSATPLPPYTHTTRRPSGLENFFFSMYLYGQFPSGGHDK